jgi:hypothetical protein
MKINWESRKLMLALLAMGVVIRLGLAIYAYQTQAHTKLADDIGYLRYGESVLEQGMLLLDIDRISHYFIGPVIAYYLALIIVFFGSNWLAIFIANALVSSMICYLIYEFCRRYICSQTAVLALFWSIFYIPQIKFIVSAGKGLLLALWVMLLIFYLMKSASDRKLSLLFIISLVFTLLIHTDERYLMYIFPVVVLVYILPDKQPPGIRLKSAGLLIGFVTLLMIPWLIRNYHVYDKIIILTPRTAHITDRIFGYEQEDYLEEAWLDRLYLDEAQIDSVVAGQKTRFDNGRPILKEQIAAMKEGNIPYTFSAAEERWSRFKMLWKPVAFKGYYFRGGYRFKQHSLKHNLAYGLCYGILIPFMIIGFIRFFIEKRKIFWTFLLILLTHTLIHVLFIPYTQERYRMPVSSLVIIAGIYGMLAVLAFLSRKKHLVPQQIS